MKFADKLRVYLNDTVHAKVINLQIGVEIAETCVAC